VPVFHDQLWIVGGHAGLASGTNDVWHDTAAFGGTLAEPQIWDYPLHDTEVYDIASGATASTAQAHAQRVEEINQANKGLLFNTPMVQTPNDRVGSLAGTAKLGSAQSGTVAPASSFTHTGDGLAQSGGVMNTDGLIAYFPMEGNMNDVIGGRNTSTGTPVYTDSKFGKSNKANYYTDIDTSLPKPNQASSFSMWVNRETVNANFGGMVNSIQVGTGFTSCTTGSWTSGNWGIMYIANAGTWTCVDSGVAANTGIHHIAYTNDGTNLNL
jgi:hypothetical protein